ncbi:MAG: cell division protein ZapA [Proteobacteria bacterium]|nr:cell division protein ZapA [Pseudomonadota bacterium]
MSEVTVDVAGRSYRLGCGADEEEHLTGLAAMLDPVVSLVGHLAGWPGGMMTTGALLSQVISNVPAAILLEGFTDDWRTLAWGVSVGGFGLAIGSMANIIALRLAREKGLWRDFHCWSLPMLFVSWSAALLLLNFFKVTT